MEKSLILSAPVSLHTIIFLLLLLNTERTRENTEAADGGKLAAAMSESTTITAASNDRKLTCDDSGFIFDKVSKRCTFPFSSSPLTIYRPATLFQDPRIRTGKPIMNLQSYVT